MVPRPGTAAAAVIEWAVAQPGGIVSWREAELVYANARLIDPTLGGGHKTGVSNVLRRYFVPVKGTRGLHVLKSTIANPDWEDDLRELHTFQAVFGLDEFGMSRSDRSGFTRMSDIG